MRRALTTLALFLALTAGKCQQSPDQHAELAKLIKIGVETSCNVSPSLLDLAAAVASVQIGPAASAIDAIVKTYVQQICEQWRAAHQVSALSANACIATVNGVCIHKQ